jgi:hypothetical protein
VVKGRLSPAARSTRPGGKPRPAHHGLGRVPRASGAVHRPTSSAKTSFILGCHHFRTPSKSFQMPQRDTRRVLLSGPSGAKTPTLDG